MGGDSFRTFGFFLMVVGSRPVMDIGVDFRVGLVGVCVCRLKKSLYKNCFSELNLVDEI